MAKKQETILDKAKSAFGLESEAIAAQSKKTVMEKPSPKKNKWEIKDRLYILKHDKTPLSYSIKTSGIYYFDEEAGYERELKYTANQRTVFVDEMKGEQRLEHVVFRNGSLLVPKNKVTLQQLLSLYHPLKDRLFEEVNKEAEAIDEIGD